MLKQTAHTLQDSFEYTGLWWLPGESEDKLSGILRYDGEHGTRLATTGTFGPWPPDSLGEPFETGIITGLTSNGIKCTLLENSRSNFNLSMPGTFEDQLRTQCLLLGEHFPARDTLVFQSFDASFQYLEEWVGRTFDTELLLQEEKITGYRVTVKSKILCRGSMPSLDGEMMLSLNYYTERDTVSEFHVVTEVFLKVRPATPQPLSYFQRLFFDVKRFLTLLVGENTYARRLRAYLPDRKPESNLPVGVYYRLPVAVTSNPFFQDLALVPFSTVSDQLPALLDRWLANAEKIQPVYDLFFSTIHKPDMYTGNRFLNLMYAVESYHRLIYGGQYLDPDEYQEVYDALVKSIPPNTAGGLKDALRGRLKYGNEYSLAKRLRLLFRNLDGELVNLVTADPEEFSRKIVGTRNYLVHRDPDSKALALDNEGMFFASHRLRILLTILLLQSLNLSDERIREAISQNTRFQPWDD